MHNGTLKPKDLNEDLITKTYTELEKGAALGYGKDWIKLDTDIISTVSKLQENLYLFSAAKTYQQLETMNSFLVDEKGKIRTFSEFKRKVDVVHKNYNKNYLETEYITSKRSAQASRQWKDIEENGDLFPNLTYTTVGDDKVREDHVLLNGITKAFNDAFWDVWFPPNGFRDRCLAKPTTKAETIIKSLPKQAKGFANNVGKTNEIFTDEHPYFTMPKGAKKNVDKSLENFKKAQKKKDE